MKSQWLDADAQRMIEDYAARGVAEDVALRVYTTRLLGSNPELVLHGGGNTSVKTEAREITGEAVEVLCVKGSGWDMGVIEPAGLPAVRLGPLLKLAALEALSDEAMVNHQRTSLLDAGAPNPSVETLLHAFVADKFIDHTHANAVLAVSDQPDGLAILHDLYGADMAVVDFVMPGFDLAKVVAAAVRAKPETKGAVLHKHGIFTFGATAREAYERMIEMVTRAEDHIARAKAKGIRKVPVSPAGPAAPADVLPILRGALAMDLGGGNWRRWVSELRDGPEVMAYVNRAELDEAVWSGVITPDHVIRIKSRPLVLPAPIGNLNDYAAEVRRRVEHYADDYRACFARNDAALPGKRVMLDPMPRIALVPGIGLAAFGATVKEARIAADLGEATVATVQAAEAVGRFEPLPELDLFAMEYWSLEQAKLSKARELPLARQVAIITGGAGAIGLATARLFVANGAAVALFDLDAEAAVAAAKSVGGNVLGIGVDVTEPEAVRTAYDAVCRAFGGVDIVVSNAGAAFTGPIATLDAAILRKSFELNFFAHQSVAQNAVQVMTAQGTGGVLLFNASKQAVNPGADFGAYGAPKAATLFLARQYALECGAQGIRANVVNADRIRSGLLTPEMIAGRAKARGVSEADYMAGNLLGLEVTARDVAEAFLAQALALKTTGNVMTVDGGNIAAALR